MMIKIVSWGESSYLTQISIEKAKVGPSMRRSVTSIGTIDDLSTCVDIYP